VHQLLTHARVGNLDYQAGVPEAPSGKTGDVRSGTRPEVDAGTKELVMVQAVSNNTVIAESDETVVVEGNHYFPRASVREDVLRDSSKQTRCPWKGLASYFTIEVDGKTNPDAAWYYPQPSDAARDIAGHVAFWKGVEVQ
jgi:uncharacterized protein (DUF427 family)